MEIQQTISRTTEPNIRVFILIYSLIQTDFKYEHKSQKIYNFLPGNLEGVFCSRDTREERFNNTDYLL